jgi:Methyltransferase domain
MRHLPEVVAVARDLTPDVPVLRRPGTARWNVIDALAPSGNVGVELGVAAGSFSARMVQSGRFRAFFGVDAYTDGHGVLEYQAALRATGLWSDYRLLRMTFDQAAQLFADESLDFIYVDGFAHSGCEGGRTLADWYPKLRPGGIMAGDDYHFGDWPLVVWAVHEAASQLKVPVHVTEEVQVETYNRYPSWSFVRPLDGPKALQFSDELRAFSDAEKARIGALRKEARRERRRDAERGTP